MAIGNNYLSTKDFNIISFGKLLSIVNLHQKNYFIISKYFTIPKLNIMPEEFEIFLNSIKKICPELTANELQKFSKGLTITKIKKNDFYIRAGQVQHIGGYVVKGLMRCYHTDEYGNEKNIYFIPEDEFAFHYSSFIENNPSPLSFQCIEPTVIINFSPEHLNQMYDEIPKLERYTRIQVEARLIIFQQRLESFLYQSTEQRYLDFITQYPSLFARIGVTNLCSYLGVERQTLTRIRKKILNSQ